MGALQRTVWRRAAALALALTGVALLAPTASAQTVGFVASAHGDVQIDRGARGAWQAALQDAEVAVGDAIRTGPDAAVKILLRDDTLLQIDEETELVVETYHLGPAAIREESILRQTRGRLRATVGAAFGESTKLLIHTPTAAVGVKGTDFEVRKRAEWEACLHSGGIVVTNAYGAASPLPGQCVIAWADRAPGDAFPNPLPPFSVEDPGPVAQDDFAEPVRSGVAADGEGAPEPPDLPGLDPGDPGDLDQYEPQLEIPEAPEPPQQDLG